MKLPEEITPPCGEFTSGEAEYSPLPGEFLQRAAPAADAPRKKRRPIQLVAGAMAAVVAVTAFVGLPLAQTETPSPPAVEATEPPTAETVPPTTPPTEPPFEMEVLESYENSGGTCVITVYADYFDVSVMGNPVLMEQTVQESGFTELALPEAPEYEGYTVSGYVIAYSPSGENLGDTNAFAVDVGFCLSLDEIQLVPVRQEDQIRYVYVHPIWIPNEGFTSWENAPVVTLDSGDEIISYPIDLPLASGGSFYVCAIVPQREGYTFAGWYDEQDRLVYTLLAEDLFTQTREDGEIDWTKPTDVTLTAKWVKNP